MTICKLLMECGVNPAHSGFHYLEMAISIRMTEPDTKLVWGIYPRVARAHHSTVERVERSCRYALKCAADLYGTVTARNILGFPPDGHYYATSDFIALAARRCNDGQQLQKACDF